jgi:hypothetical protein
MLMVMFTKESGTKTKLMVKENIFTQMERYMMGIGNMINSMVMVWSTGLMVLIMMENSC